MRICEVCGKVFKPKLNQKYCSTFCRSRARFLKQKKIIVRLCNYCGEPFQMSSKYRAFCSDECRNNFHYTSTNGKIRLCKHCGEPFRMSNEHILFCSRECQKKHQAFLQATFAPKPKLSSLDKKIKAADALGISYGQYMARLRLMENGGS